MTNDIPQYNEKLGLALRHDGYNITDACRVVYEQATDDFIEQVINPQDEEIARLKDQWQDLKDRLQLTIDVYMNDETHDVTNAAYARHALEEIKLIEKKGESH